MRIVVTGANGYVGNAFVNEYAQVYDMVRVSLRETSISEIDFTDVETVLHLSALVHQKGQSTREEYFKVNTRQTIALAKAAKSDGVKHFVFFSTVAVYGIHGYLQERAPSIDESTECKPVDPYGESKLIAEQGLMRLESEDFKVSIIRPPIVYGRNSPGNMERLRKLIRLFPALPFKYTDNKRSIIGINNLIFFTNMVIERKVDGVLIPQDNEAHSIQDLVTTLAKVSSKRIYLFKIPGFLFRYLCRRKERLMSSLYGTLVFDSTVSNSRLGFVPPNSTEQELLLMCDENKDR